MDDICFHLCLRAVSSVREKKCNLRFFTIAFLAAQLLEGKRVFLIAIFRFSETFSYFCLRRSPDHGTVDVVVVVVVVLIGGTTLVFDFFKILKSL